MVCLALAGCEGSGAPSSEAPAGEARPRSEPIEFVGLSVELPLEGPEDLEGLLEPAVGDDARAGAGMTDFELQPGLFLSAIPDSRTPDQVILELQMQPVDRSLPRRVIARVPASFDYGRIFIDTAQVALERANTVIAEEGEGEMEPFLLEHRLRSVSGGGVTLAVELKDGRDAVLRVTTQTPETSLRPGLVNAPAFSGEPTEVLAGTVWFELTRDQFDFFSTRAYGITAGAAQNFEDFRLLPHEWLRLTVTPRLEDELVDVGFEVVALDGRRVQFARAPASLLAGDQFRENVFRMVQNMLEAERALPGSSNRFTVPFHYDDPEGGGVVRVIAQGQGGTFRIAYGVESPVNRLRDVEFVGYQGVLDLPDPDELVEPDTSCADVGSTDAIEGRLRVRFDASSTVRDSDELTLPLRGDVYGSIFRASDVTLAGPNDGAESVASFHFEDVDVTVPGEGEEYLIDAPLPRGEYQILGFLDIDDDSVDADPDEGDPVTLPIGGYDVECAENPVVVEFALLLPPGR